VNPKSDSELTLKDNDLVSMINGKEESTYALILDLGDFVFMLSQ
jgi:hypothetical protein